MRPSHRLSGVLFLALAAVLAWGGTVDPEKTAARWIAVAALAGWGVWTLWRERTGLERVYQQILALGLTSGAIGWLIPARESRGLVTMGGILVLVAGGLLIRSRIQRNASDDDADHTG